MCHPLLLAGVDLDFAIDRAASCVHIQATVRTCGPTGVEMEALTAVSAAALTIYDMCKAVDKGMTITHIRLVEKTGGKSGVYRREGEGPFGNEGDSGGKYRIGRGHLPGGWEIFLASPRPLGYYIVRLALSGVEC